ncbi:hypothetical protein BCR37DRAFT_377423 [Protomyces lactucae-debilis]|uniref:Uncharacterized protein n=1 Tax=Protomyces lactucae-debilis TaxID=2754530 RepID=A0A1Y2FQW2_PROLT|nr:uncharacterized protein BCR37DRAFT_377423 [Protomyces lactucae-debilis]ORY85714.1 hypothetical protein BCR37DRAFT_377423 [Protomyces lactucae-debilis]
MLTNTMKVAFVAACGILLGVQAAVPPTQPQADIFCNSKASHEHGVENVMTCAKGDLKWEYSEGKCKALCK